ncbi:MAG: GNAT family N-acetyltransferase [Gemmataceae bacterium]
MVQYRRNQELLYETPEAMPENWQPQSAVARQILDKVQAENRTLLNEVEAKQFLAAYGIPVVPSVACSTMEETASSAQKMGFPVVLKLLSNTVTHKSDVGGVMLNLKTEEEVCKAFHRIRENVTQKVNAKAFEGVSVQPMVQDKGFELIIGSSLDKQFGPVILFGSGGILVEVIKDRALGLPPLNRTLARRLMERTQIYKALKGVRGQKPVDLSALETLLVRFSQLLCDFVEIQEVDLNPVIASPERILALDARVLLTPVDHPAPERPQLAIRPYPNQYTHSFDLKDGTKVNVRAIRPEDEPLIIDLHSRHSEHTIRMRFFSLVKTLSRDSLIRLCHLDYDREMALAAVDHSGEKPRILGVARYYSQPETGEAEFAVVVEDAYQRQGIGRHLLSRLMTIAKERGVTKLQGQILRENAPMLSLTSSLGFGPPQTVENDVVQVEKVLGKP